MRNKDILLAKKYLNLFESAKSRNLEFDLEINDVRRLLNTNKCFYSGELLTDSENDANKRTIDRVDNSKGYIKGNVVACSKKFNFIKSSLSVEEIILLYKGLKKKKLAK